MKQFAAIVFSLLLIVAQTFAVPAPVSSGVAVAKPACCGEDCQCSVSQSGAPAAPPVESTAPAAAQNQFVLPPVATVIFTLAAPVENSFSSSDRAELRAAATPIFLRNCSLLI